MKTSRFLLSAVLLCGLSTVAQSQQDQNTTPLPLVSPEEAVRRSQPQPISLHLTNVTLRDALNELARQNHVTLDLSNGDLSILRISADIETPFFRDALAKLTESLDVEEESARIWESDNTWYVHSTPFGNKVPTSYNVPLKVQLLRVENTAQKDFQFSEIQQQSDVRFSFAFSRDPRFIFLGTPEVRVTRILNTLGQSLDKSVRVENQSSWIPDEKSNKFSIKFASQLPIESNKISRLEGNILCTIPTKHERWLVDRVSEGELPSHIFQCNEQQVRVGVEFYTAFGNRIQLIIKVESLSNGIPAKIKLPVSAKQILYKMHLYNSDGQQIISTGYNDKVESQGQSLIVANFLIPLDVPLSRVQTKPIQPISFSLDMPVEFVQTEVPFSFSDLPLP